VVVVAVAAAAVAVVAEGSLEVNLPTIWTDGKAELGRGRVKTRAEERR